MSAKSALGVKGSSAHVGGQSRGTEDARRTSAASLGRKSRIARTSSVLLTLMVEGRRAREVPAGEANCVGWASLSEASRFATGHSELNAEQAS